MKEEQWVSIKKELPDYRKYEMPNCAGVTVDIKTEHGLIGECLFGYSGAPGEPMSGDFWMPIRNAKGDVHFDNPITHWKYKNQ